MSPRVPYLELIHEYFGRIINLFKKHDIKCVFVLDGARNPLKFMENERRKQHVLQAEQKLKKVYESMQGISTTELNKLKKNAIQVDEYMVAELISYFQRNNHLYIVAPCEADSQLLYMQSNKLVDYIMSEDTDIIALGGTNVIQNLDYRSEKCNIVKQEKLNQYFIQNFQRVPTQCDKFAWCIMLGCDYIKKNMDHFPLWLNEKVEELKLNRLRVECKDTEYYKTFLEVYHYFYSQPVFSISSLTDIESVHTTSNITMKPLYLIKKSEGKLTIEWLEKWKLILSANTTTTTNDASFFRDVAMGKLWCRTGKALDEYIILQRTVDDPITGEKLELPWGSDLDTETLPLQYHCREALLNFISARNGLRGEIKKGCTIEELITVYRTVMNVEPTPVAPATRIGEHELSIDVYTPVDKIISRIKGGDALISIISEFPCQFDDDWIDKYYKYPEDGLKGGIGVTNRALARFRSGHVDIRTMKYASIRCKRSDMEVTPLVHFFGCNVKPSMIDAINYVQLAFDENFNYIPSPTSRCACTDGQGFCSHMFAVILFMRKCQLFRGKSYKWHLEYMPPFVDSIYNEIITAQFICNHI
jgi:hypothetical protein